MSIISKIFGSSGKKENSGSPQEAIQHLKETEEMLQKKSDFLEKKIEQEIAFAKLNGSKNKRAALQALKRKRRFEKQLQQVDGMLSTIDFQLDALENATTNTEVVNVMSHAAKALKSAHKNMNVDDIQNMMDEISDQQELASQISDAISSSVGFGQDIDDDDILAELEQLEQETLEEQLLNVESVIDSLPVVPDAQPTSPNKKHVLKTGPQSAAMAEIMRKNL